MPELPVTVLPVGGCAFQHLRGTAKAVAVLAQQPPDRRVADLEPLTDQFIGQGPGDFTVQRNGFHGSPRSSGSISASSASHTPWHVCSIPGRPAPGRRIRRTGALSSARSRIPAPTVLPDSPVTAATALAEPSPNAKANAPADSRKSFSSRYGAIDAKNDEAT